MRRTTNILSPALRSIEISAEASGAALQSCTWAKKIFFQHVHDCKPAKKTFFEHMHDCKPAKKTFFEHVHDCNPAKKTFFARVHDCKPAEKTFFAHVHDCNAWLSIFVNNLLSLRYTKQIILLTI